jgi:hypothetical protein
LQHPLAYAMVPKLNLLEVHYEARIDIPNGRFRPSGLGM